MWRAARRLPTVLEGGSVSLSVDIAVVFPQVCAEPES